MSAKKLPAWKTVEMESDFFHIAFQGMKQPSVSNESTASEIPTAMIVETGTALSSAAIEQAAAVFRDLESNDLPSSISISALDMGIFFS